MLLIGAILCTSICPARALRVPNIRSLNLHSDQKITATGSSLAGRRTSSLRNNTYVCLLSQLSRVLVVFATSQFTLLFASRSSYGLAGKPAAALAYLDLDTRSSRSPLHTPSPGTHTCHTVSVRKAILLYVFSVCVTHCCTSTTVGGAPCWWETLANSPQASFWYVPCHEHPGSTIDHKYS